MRLGIFGAQDIRSKLGSIGLRQTSTFTFILVVALAVFSVVGII